MGREVLNHIKWVPNHPDSVTHTEPGGRPILFIVIHTAESGEGVNTAEDVAAWLSRGGAGKPAGCHYVVDRNSVVQMAQTAWTTAGARGHVPGHSSANHYAVHIELAGRANQTPAQWSDDASTETLKNCAWLCGQILVPKFNLPVKHLTTAQLLALDKGFVGHVDITKACHVQGGHVDPGPGFPWSWFLQWVAEAEQGTLK